MSSRHWPRRAPLPGPNTWLAARKSEAGRPPRAPAPRPAPAPRLGRRELRGPRLGPGKQPYLAQGHLSLHTGAPRAAGAGHAAHPRRPLCPFSHCLLLFWPQAAGPPVSAEPCAPPCSPHLRGGLRPAALAALPPPRPLSRRGRWSRLPGVARPEPLDSGISHHAAPDTPGSRGALWTGRGGCGRGAVAAPPGTGRARPGERRVPGRTPGGHARPKFLAASGPGRFSSRTRARATARPAPRPADLAPRAPASASPSVSGLALGPRTCSGVVTGAASGPDPTRLAQRVPACPADARARGQRS